jgi:hypothetical protein
MSAPRERLQVYLPPPVAARVRAIAASRDISVNDVVRMAIGVLDVAEDARLKGHHVGVTKHRERLDIVMVSPL